MEGPAKPAAQTPQRGEMRTFFWKVLLVAGTAALLFLLWRVRDALLLVFAGALLGILLGKMTQAVRRWAIPNRAIAYAAVLVALAGAVALVFWQAGSTIAAQFDQFSSQLERAIGRLPQGLRDQLAQQGQELAWLGELSAVATNVVWFVGDLVVIVFVAVYLAASPDLYRRGLVLLVPPDRRRRAHEVIDVCHHALWRWMQGQLASMATVGALVTVTLLVLGVPGAVVLGLIAFTLEFIPLLGPFLAAAPALLIAFSESTSTALWVAGAYVVIQQVEGNVIYPLVQKRAVSLPPAVTIAAVVAGGLLFGLMGLFLATPLAVLTLTLVNLLYIEDRLKEGRHFPD